MTEPSEPTDRPSGAGRAHQVTKLVGVYDADGTLRGELTYFIGARLGRAHCALCDITHGLVRRRSEWTACKEGLPVAFETYHRNDQPDPVRAATGDVTPVVVAETDTGVVVLLGPAELEECASSVDRLVDALESALRRHDLSWPPGPVQPG